MYSTIFDVLIKTLEGISTLDPNNSIIEIGLDVSFFFK